MRNFERECPYCGGVLSNSSVVLREDGSISGARGDVYWCQNKHCRNKMGILRSFKEDEDGFLVECGVEDIDDIDDI